MLLITPLAERLCKSNLAAENRNNVKARFSEEGQELEEGPSPM